MFKKLLFVLLMMLMAACSQTPTPTENVTEAPPQQTTTLTDPWGSYIETRLIGSWDNITRSCTIPQTPVGPTLPGVNALIHTVKMNEVAQFWKVQNGQVTQIEVSPVAIFHLVMIGYETEFRSGHPTQDECSRAYWANPVQFSISGDVEDGYRYEGKAIQIDSTTAIFFRVNYNGSPQNSTVSIALVWVGDRDLYQI